MAQGPAHVFNGRYEIVRRIARGGMAEVYLARDLLLDRPVALKVLFPELSVDRAFVERFRREAQAAANLSHPNIVSVYDWGEEDGTYFIVMEYVEGRPLSTLIRAEGTLLADRVADIGAAVAGALAFAHRNGVIHRDVKPGNVLIDGTGHAKVTDFGIARAAGTQENLTQTGAVMGTATYFSPEQAQGYGVDGRSDVYSLGVVLYEMLTGRPPFSGDNPVTVAYKHVREEPTAPRQVNPVIPAAIEAIVLQAMAKDPDDRYPTAEELRADLLRFRQGRAVTAVPPVAAPATQAMPATTVQPAAANATQVLPQTAVTTVEDEPRERHTGAYVVLLFVMLAALAVLLFLFGRTVGLFGGDDTATDVTVPSVIGKHVDEATSQLKALGFEVTTEFAPNDTAEANIVFDQDPRGDTKATKGSAVKLSVSQGAAPVEVPDVVGEDIRDAESALRAAGFDVGRTDVADEKEPAGKVLAQDPAGGQEAPKGTKVNLTVSSGKPKVVVPNVAGKDGDDAIVELTRAGLTPKRVSEPSADVPEGKVIRTDPAAGTSVEKDTTVRVFVSSGPQQVSVPDVVGKTEAEAKKILTDAGFKVATSDRVAVDPSDDGRVIDQDPDAGDKAPQGSTVTITIGRL